MRSPRHGFTLIELLLVVFILAMLAASTSALVDGAHEQARFDDTRNRLEQIRRAVIGPDDLTLPTAGFIADMGRPPSSLQELLQNPDPSNPALLFKTDAATGVGTGWRGPYLRTLVAQSGRLEFPDGWGNPDLVQDDPNFGWIFDTFDPSGDPHPELGTQLPLTEQGDLRVTCRGLDGSVSAEDAVHSILIRRSDYEVDLGAWRIVVDIYITNPDPNPATDDPSISSELVIRIWRPDGIGGLTSDRDADNVTTISTPVSITFDPDDPDTSISARQRSLTFEFPPTAGSVEQGIRAVEICAWDAVGSMAAPLNDPVFASVDLRARASRPLRLPARLTMALQ